MSRASFSAEYSVFQFAIQKLKNQNIHNYNFACYCVWVRNLAGYIEEGTQAEGVEENILA